MRDETITKEEWIFQYLDEHDLLISSYDLEKKFEEYLSDVYGDVDICGLTYDSAYALKNLDETAYDVRYSDWLSEEYIENDFDSEYYQKQDDYDEAEDAYEDWLEEENEEDE